MQVPSAITIMPPEPSVEPTSHSASWESGRSLISAPVSTLEETPPGTTHLMARSSRTPPQSSSRNFIHG